MYLIDDVELSLEGWYTARDHSRIIILLFLIARYGSKLSLTVNQWYIIKLSVVWLGNMVKAYSYSLMNKLRPPSQISQRRTTCTGRFWRERPIKSHSVQAPYGQQQTTINSLLPQIWWTNWKYISDYVLPSLPCYRAIQMYKKKKNNNKKHTSENLAYFKTLLSG